MPRDAYLAHQQQIKWRMQRAGDLDADRNAATRQCKDQRMGLLQISELLRQLPPGIATVAEQMTIHHVFQTSASPDLQPGPRCRVPRVSAFARYNAEELLNGGVLGRYARAVCKRLNDTPTLRRRARACSRGYRPRTSHGEVTPVTPLFEGRSQ